MTIEIKPDWSKAPAWANYWAVDIDGSAYWYAKEPQPNLDDEGDDYGVWIGDKCPAIDEEWVKNWKETLCVRHEAEATPQYDVEVLRNEFNEFKKLLSCELSEYNERLKSLEKPKEIKTYMRSCRK